MCDHNVSEGFSELCPSLPFHLHSYSGMFGLEWFSDGALGLEAEYA